MFDMFKKIASKSYDESTKVMTEGKNPIKSAESVKKYAEKLEKQAQKKQ